MNVVDIQLLQVFYYHLFQLFFGITIILCLPYPNNNKKFTVWSQVEGTTFKLLLKKEKAHEMDVNSVQWNSGVSQWDTRMIRFLTFTWSSVVALTLY